MTTDKIELDIDSYLNQLLASKNIRERQGYMAKILTHIEALPLSEQQEWLEKLQLSIRKDFDEISSELQQL